VDKSGVYAKPPRESWKGAKSRYNEKINSILKRSYQEIISSSGILLSTHSSKLFSQPDYLCFSLRALNGFFLECLGFALVAICLFQRRSPLSVIV